MTQATNNCPRCGNHTRKVDNQRFCERCHLYKVNGKWMRVCCDEYHQHSRKCLIEYKP